MLSADIQRQLEDALRNSIEPLVFQLRFEWQDGGDFLLISAVPKPNTSDDETHLVVAKIKAIADPVIPPIKGDYCWMLILKDGDDVRSAFMSDMGT